MEVFSTDANSKYRLRSNHAHGRGVFQCMAIIALILFVTCMILVLFNFVRGHREVTKQVEILQAAIKAGPDSHEECEDDYCITKGCVIAASRILSLRDTSVDPCQDFYEYSCGGYGTIRAPRLYEEAYSLRSEVMDNIHIGIKKFMDNIDIGEKSQALTKAKILYESCISTIDRLNETSVEALHEFFAVSGLQWPILATDEEPHTTWIQLVDKMEGYGIHTLFKSTFEAVGDNPVGTIEVDCTLPMLPSEYYLHPSDRRYSNDMNLYRNLIENVLKNFQIRREARRAFSQDIIQFETEVSQALAIPLSSAESPLSPEHKQQLREVWQRLFGASDTAADVKSVCKGNLEEALRVVNNTPAKTILNYIGWRVVSQLLRYMSSEFRHIYVHQIGRLPNGPHVFASVWKECSDLVREQMGIPAAKALETRGYFSQDQLDEVKDMLINLKRAFGFLFQTVPWMDANTTVVFAEKLINVKLNIGFPDILNEEGRLDALYAELTLNEEDSLFTNMLKLRAFNTNHYFSRFRQHGEEFLFRDVSLEHSPLEIEPHYNYVTNTIYFDLGLLVPPMHVHGTNTPRYLKYGQAVFLAHQLSHAFDTTGNFFDAAGHRRGIDWWPDLVKQKFHEFVTCLVQDHAGDYAAGIIARPEVINDEIADLGSFFVTYAGLVIHLQANGTDMKPLLGLTLDAKQTYFLQIAQTFCEVRDKLPVDSQRKPTKSQKLRVNGVISNTEDFGTVFNCPIGSPMNPEHKCNLLQ